MLMLLWANSDGPCGAGADMPPTLLVVILTLFFVMSARVSAVPTSHAMLLADVGCQSSLSTDDVGQHTMWADTVGHQSDESDGHQCRAVQQSLILRSWSLMQ